MSTKRYQKINSALAENVKRKTAGACYYCGVQLPPDEHILDHGGKVVIKLRRWHVDHKQPVIRGGTDDLENLVPACSSCNLRKHDKTEEEFRQESSL